MSWIRAHGEKLFVDYDLFLIWVVFLGLYSSDPLYLFLVFKLNLGLKMNFVLVECHSSTPAINSGQRAIRGQDTIQAPTN